MRWKGCEGEISVYFPIGAYCLPERHGMNRYANNKQRSFVRSEGMCAKLKIPRTREVFLIDYPFMSLCC